MILTESQIAQLLDDRKPLTRQQRITLKEPLESTNNGRVRARLRLKSDSDRHYEIRTTLSKEYPHKFAVNAFYRPTPRTLLFLLRLCGPGKGHVNVFEMKNRSGVMRIPKDSCHVHWITARYLAVALGKPDGYAEPCDEYDSLATAVDYMAFSFGFYDPEHPSQTTMHPLLKG